MAQALCNYCSGEETDTATHCVLNHSIILRTTIGSGANYQILQHATAAAYSQGAHSPYQLGIAYLKSHYPCTQILWIGTVQIVASSTDLQNTLFITEVTLTYGTTVTLGGALYLGSLTFVYYSTAQT